MLTFDKFTERSKGFITAAQLIAVNLRHQNLLTEHLLKALLEDREGLASNLIRTAGGDPQKAHAEVDAVLAKIPQVFASGSADQLRMTPEMARLISTAEDVAKKAGDSFVTVERLLLAISLSTGTQSQKILADAG